MLTNINGILTASYTGAESNKCSPLVWWHQVRKCTHSWWQQTRQA